MSSTTFAFKSTIIPSAWLNDVNAVTYSRANVKMPNNGYTAAVGDGVTDDTAAIQSCIDANPGKIIYFPRATYKIAGTLTVSSDSTWLVGDNANINQYTANVDSILFKPTTAGTTSAFLNQVRVSGLRVNHVSSVAAVATQGAGIRFLQCNGYNLDNVVVNDAFEGIVLQGGQLGSLSSFAIFAAAGSYSGVGTSLLSLKQAPVGAGWQSCFTVRLSDFHMSATLLRESCILVANVDGLDIENCYVANAKTALIKFAAERDNSYIAAVAINGYLDCVGSGKTTYGIYIPADAYTNSWVYHVKVGPGTTIGNTDFTGILARKAELVDLHLEGVSIINTGQWAVDAECSNSNTDVVITGCAFNSNGIDNASGTLRLNTCRSFTVVGNKLAGTKQVGLLLGGTFSRSCTVAGNNNITNAADIDYSAATFSSNFTMAGNSSQFVGFSAQSWCGTRLANIDSSDPRVMDHYLEGTFTPGITFGGAAVGVTYGAQTGSYTREGNRVKFTIVITLTSKGSSTGALLVTGLPVTVNDVGSPSCSLYATALTAGVGDTMLMASPANAGTTIRLYKMAGGVATQLTDADLTGTSDIRLTGEYRV